MRKRNGKKQKKGSTPNGAALATQIREDLGVRVTWPEAEEILCMSRRTIQANAFDSLRQMAGNLKAQKALLAAEGFQFCLAGRLVWMGRRGRNYVIRIRA